MLTAERKRKLLDVLRTEGKILASDLSRRFGVSEDTVRRDLRELDRAGLLQPRPRRRLPRPPVAIDYLDRERESTDAKKRIGAAAARLLHPGEVIALDAGTTPLAVAEHLPADLAVTVVTHGLTAAIVLAEHPAAEGVVVGGRLFKSARASVGVSAVDAYRLLRPDACILGAAGVHPEAGVTTLDGEEAEVKRDDGGACGTGHRRCCRGEARHGGALLAHPDGPPHAPGHRPHCLAGGPAGAPRARHRDSDGLKPGGVLGPGGRRSGGADGTEEPRSRSCWRNPGGGCSAGS